VWCCSWIYPDGLNMVCDVFVMSMYKAGGLLEPYTNQIQVSFIFLLQKQTQKNSENSFSFWWIVCDFCVWGDLFELQFVFLWLTISRSQIIQVTEFTPRDSYQMDFFLLSKSQRPPPCQVDDLPYCRILPSFLGFVRSFIRLSPHSLPLTLSLKKFLANIK
jgi:hypothetical protein